MSIVVVVGGQFGGEGKGKMTAHLCHEYGFDVAVRCGGQILEVMENKFISNGV